MKNTILIFTLLFSALSFAAEKELSFVTRQGNTFKKEWIKAIQTDIQDNDLDELLTRKLDKKEVTKLKCSNYSSLNEEDRKKFWIIFMTGISAAECNYNPKCFYAEPGTNDSYGLLQIDAPNSRAHGCVKRDGSRPKGGKEGRKQGGDMYNPEVNLRCGMYIVRNQLRRSGELFYKKSYWAVLREGRKGHLRFMRFINTNMHKVSGCK